LYPPSWFFALKRILIVGCCGAGKSTLARKIHALTQLPLIHLDQEYWLPGWVEPGKKEWEQKVGGLIRAEKWIIDGNYGGTLDLRISRADTVIFLDASRWVCLFRVIKRILLHYGRVRPDSAAACPERFSWEFIKYVYRFQDAKRPALITHMKTLAEDREVFILRSDGEIRAFLRKIEKADSL
jgi:adenylate kinase family enzyme